MYNICIIEEDTVIRREIKTLFKNMDIKQLF